MKVTHQIVAVLVLGACAATFAQADARPGSGKHPADAAGHVGTHHRPGLAKPLRNAAPVAPVRNAIGAVTPPAGVGSAAATRSVGVGSPASVVTPNAINAHTGTVVVSPAGPAGAVKIGSTTNPANAVRAVPVLPAHTGGINGTGMARPGNTLGTIGGPAKVAGGISGTGIKQKR